MISILMNTRKHLVVTKSKTIYQGENETERLRFIIPIQYSEDVCLKDFVCSLYITLPDGTKPDAIELTQEPEYKDTYVTYTFDVKSDVIASQQGEVALRLYFTKIVTTNENTEEEITETDTYILKTSTVLIDIE